MTSLQLFNHPEPTPKVPDEWGTGKAKGETDIWLPKPPSWHQTDIPVKQFYDLTALKRSNLRDNDQLLPRPEASNMGSILIDKSFPAEHPYDSHISKFAVFPTFASPQDPNRGVDAIERKPLHAETPANSYDVRVLHKTKGAPFRQEVLTLVPETQKKALVWNGENNFDQVVKAHGNRQTFYPTPIKSVAPNHQQRPVEHQVSERTADTMRNVERSHWLTTSQLDYTGIGPSNPLKIDNLDDKKSQFLNTGELDERLYPHFTNTFDPPRPYEGRIARRNIMPSKTPPPIKRSSYDRKLTEHEREEHRLFNGTEYKNFPDTTKDPSADRRWQEIDNIAKSETMMEKLESAIAAKPFEKAPFQPAGSPPPKAPGYLQTTKIAQDEIRQTMEAQNRHKVLEAQTPKHNIESLHYKYGHLNVEEQPSKFYDHGGKYSEERSDMYKTSYDPHKLTYSMNKDEVSGSVLTDTSRSHEGALYIPTSLSQDNKALLKRSKTFCGNAGGFTGDKQSPRQVSAPYHGLREHQKAQLQPHPQTARPIIQEGEFVLRETTMGESYNTPKYLQQNKTLPFTRNEPLNIMSKENQDLRKVRSRSLPRTAKSVQFSDRVTVAHLDADQPSYIDTAPLRGLTDDEKSVLAGLKTCNANTTQYTSTEAEWKKENEVEILNGAGYRPSFGDSNPAVPRFGNSNSSNTETNLNRTQKLLQDIPTEERSIPQSTGPSLFRKQPGNSASEYRSEFEGELVSEKEPSSLRRSSSFRSSYPSQYPIYHDLSLKSHPRFDWKPVPGTPRPQTTLLQIQDSFSKTEVKKKFNRDFPEKAPEIRDHIKQGKKHVFGGVHGQLIHG